MAAQDAEPSLSDIVAAAGARPAVRQAVAGVYEDIRRATEQRRPRCVMSGRCCRFEAYGHRLFITTMELACFHHDLFELRAKQPHSDAPPWDGAGCPFQIGKLCSVHAIRPMGCRLFFCDESAEQWQQTLYERAHGELRRLHEALQVPYRYMEWRQALREIGLAPAL